MEETNTIMVKVVEQVVETKHLPVVLVFVQLWRVVVSWT